MKNITGMLGLSPKVVVLGGRKTKGMFSYNIVQNNLKIT